MENALLVGLSRQVALRRELDVIANNLANLGTTGFKGEAIQFEQYLSSPAREDNFPLSDRTVSFVIDRATLTDFTQGSVERTGSQLDVALDGEGFLVVETPNGERYTRNGSLSRNATGELVNSEGYRLLGLSGPITLDPSDNDISIAEDGTVSAKSGERGRLRIVRFASTQQLSKEGGSLFTSSAAALPAEPRTRLIQGAIERSNVRPILEMGRMIEVTRAYSTLANLLSRTDELRRMALEKLAEVPA